MIVVTHLLGTGHLARALVLARAIVAQGHDALVVSGGFPVPLLDRGDVPLRQLPPLRSDGVAFTRLRDAENEIASATYLDARRKILCDTYTEFAPDVLMTELFPFGRRVLRDEFVAVLDAAQRDPAQPCVVASIRDILAPPSKPAKVTATENLVAHYYDAVLVHSDASITPLDASWPDTAPFASKLHYTGFVAPKAAGPHPQALGRGRIVVSVGGGTVGAPLLAAARRAAEQDLTLHWHILVGGRAVESRVAELAHDAPSSLTVEPARPDFRQMLYHAQASVSLCGYNTALDILQAGTPAVFVPFDDGGEVEQMLRARALQHLPGIGVLPASELSPERLRKAVTDVIQAPARPPLRSGLDGAAETARILNKLTAERIGAH